MLNELQETIRQLYNPNWYWFGFGIIFAYLFEVSIKFVLDRINKWATSGE